MDTIFKRSIYEKIIENIPKRHIIVLIGARQVGKSTLMYMIREQVINTFAAPTLFIDAERDQVQEDLKTYSNAIRFLTLKGLKEDQRFFLFIDEFQKIAHITPVLKSLYDYNPNIKLIISGSSSLELRGKLDESMAGRKRIFEILPLEFKEYLEFIQSESRDSLAMIDYQDADSSIFTYFIKEFDAFMLFGGYPKIVLTAGINEKIEELAEIYRSYIEKDIINYLKVENVDAFNKLFKILCVQIGSQCNLNTLTTLLGTARDTIQKYLHYQEKTYQIYLLKSFYTNKIKEIIKMPKVYSLDTGMRNFVIRNFNEFILRDDSGHIAENAVFLEMLKNKDILQNFYYWRTKNQTEVDFIIEHNGNLFPVEVKYGSNISSNVPTNLKTFFSHYPSATSGFIVTKRLFKKITYEDKEIFFVPAFLSERVVRHIVSPCL